MRWDISSELATRTTLTFEPIAMGVSRTWSSLFLNDRAVWWRLLNHPIPAHYRLHGAKPDLARQQLTMPGSLQPTTT